ncbi:MAG: hypothetical protein L6Q37_14325 [Bdellovibrionaceae bacterium]|nr:hypothetical protein [Pseudobdellovibrionaceae bacterium]NUM58467.1 hypothetical protein [Pseudobdellovibrionaceae bacterium]
MKTKTVMSIFLLSTSIAIAEIKPNDSWFKCQNSNECEDIDYECAGGIVNKSFAKEAREYYQLMNARSNCIRTEPSEKQRKIPYKVFCEKSKCNKQGINPKKPGFS